MRPAKLKVGLVQQAVADNDKATNWNKSAEKIAKLRTATDEHIGLEIIHLFVIDLLGRNTPAAQIFRYKTEEE